MSNVTVSSLLDMENLQIEDVEREMETEKQIAEVESKEAEQQEQEEVLQDYGMLPDADGKSQSLFFYAPTLFINLQQSCDCSLRANVYNGDNYVSAEYFQVV